MWSPIGPDAAQALPAPHRRRLFAKVEEFGDDFSAAMGAEGIRALLRSLDSTSRSTSCAGARGYLVRRQDQEDRQAPEGAGGFKQSNIKPDWMIMEVLPVLPPELRPSGPPGRWSFCHLGPERSLPARHQQKQ